ncbi:TetR/AcrR family transcriptional regulator [Loigolactobacillus bifermentans]|jgi:AcrR family transcriptional regulator|nr:TetR/AcrR family transcriptional regulator [Loigolactobacillus bifermentans]QGG60211.1 TetR family transcriptional regulator [Loigolactobacillus bifermentans]
MAKRPDLRVIRTKRMIINAFMKLVTQHGFDAVTIQQIADEAMINRATFYAHFKDKQDLFDQILQITTGSFLKILDADILFDGNKIKMKTIERTLTEIFKEIQDNRSFFQLATDGSNNVQLVEQLQILLQQRYAELFDNLHITQNQTEIPTDFIIAYMTSIFMGTVRWWVHSDGSFSPDHLAHLIIQLIANGHLTVLGIELVDA